MALPHVRGNSRKGPRRRGSHRRPGRETRRPRGPDDGKPARVDGNVPRHFFLRRHGRPHRRPPALARGLAHPARFRSRRVFRLRQDRPARARDHGYAQVHALGRPGGRRRAGRPPRKRSAPPGHGPPARKDGRGGGEARFVLRAQRRAGRRRVVDHLHVRHDGPPQGGHAHARQLLRAARGPAVFHRPQGRQLPARPAAPPRFRIHRELRGAAGGAVRNLDRRKPADDSGQHARHAPDGPAGGAAAGGEDARRDPQEAPEERRRAHAHVRRPHARRRAQGRGQPRRPPAHHHLRRRRQRSGRAPRVVPLRHHDAPGIRPHRNLPHQRARAGERHPLRPSARLCPATSCASPRPTTTASAKSRCAAPR